MNKGIGPSEALMKQLVKRKIPSIQLKRPKKFQKQDYGMPKFSKLR